jgi:hypothetical protein
LFAPHAGAHSSITCEYWCGNACAHPEPNPSGNEYVGDVVKDVVSPEALSKPER